MQKLIPGDVVTYTEYSISQLSGRRHARQRMENMIVHAVIAPHETLSKDRIEEYFGPDLSPDVSRALAVSPVTRLILKDDDEQLYCVELVEDFLASGVQTIEMGMQAKPQAAEDGPSYLQFLNALGG